MRLILVTAFGVSFVLSFLLTAIVRRIARRLNFVDVPGGRKQHAEPTPHGGGIAIVIACSVTVLGAVLGAFVIERNPDFVGLPPDIFQDVGRAVDRLPLLIKVLAGGIAIALFGLWDDIRPFRPLTKLILQFVIAGIIVLSSGMRISMFIPYDWVQAAITIVWIVLLTNTFNLLDNMDGLSGSMAFICAGALLILALQSTQFFIAGLMLALAGALLGFLFFNFPPASIFMGDTGSMFIGYILATGTVLTTFVNATGFNPLFPVIVPLVIFAVPLYDTASVLLIRLHHGKSLLAGDRNHLSHRLNRLGMSERRVLFTIALLTLATSLGATLPYGSSFWRAIVPVLQ
ncbi:MAG: undecaprenyl/decaprenyl-phosphate alpha-N-acetylglucosaminyl 1-phosphate transferase, partial [Planctomycetes bacterium]|nr:undecaprenyl/decaprenyl-phosphate alpha-N-acetylglucosaminyl 1-phosphate transferase [Planctomycetota bacterium]